jgi:hypothetical protein
LLLLYWWKIDQAKDMNYIFESVLPIGNVRAQVHEDA